MSASSAGAWPGYTYGTIERVSAPTQPGPSTFGARIRAATGDRTVGAMFLLGLGAGLPYAVLTGTLNAWFTEAHVDVSTIGVLSWIGLAYAFKFLWSPALQRSSAPGPLRRLGARRGWILTFQTLVAASITLIALSDPTAHLGIIALAALTGVAAAASGDIVIDAWRIEIARDDGHLDTLSSVYQFGFRLAAILGGAAALLVAARIGWNLTFLLLAATMLLAVCGTLLASEPDRARLAASAGSTPALGDRLPARTRHAGIVTVLALWAWAVVMLGDFMVRTLVADTPPDARRFMAVWGPWIVAATVLAPAAMAALMSWLERRDTMTPPAPAAPAAPGPHGPLATLFRAILEPLMDLIGRLGWAAPLVLVLILSYRFADLVWGAFAYPFYLGTEHGALGHSLDEVALASKIIGALVTVAGIAIGGVALRTFGRMTCLVAGAALAAATNLLFYDLASGATVLGGVLHSSGSYAAFAVVGVDARLANLITAIAGENLAVGFATVVFVAYLSSIVNPRYAAVQYALLASLTMLIGTLGRGALGQLIESEGFGYVFVLTAALGLVAVAAAAGEALRSAWQARRER